MHRWYMPEGALPSRGGAAMAQARASSAVEGRGSEGARNIVVSSDPLMLGVGPVPLALLGVATPQVCASKPLTIAMSLRASAPEHQRATDPGLSTAFLPGSKRSYGMGPSPPPKRGSWVPKVQSVALGGCLSPLCSGCVAKLAANRAAGTLCLWGGERQAAGGPPTPGIYSASL